MKIVFIETPSKWLVREHAQMPLGILYLTTLLKKFKYDVSIYRPKDIHDYPVDCNVICFSGTTLEYTTIVSMAKNIKSKNSDIKILLGGVHVTCTKKADGIFDSICIGEGEKVIFTMLDDCKNKCLKRVYYGSQVYDLNNIPIPDRSLIPGIHGKDIFAENKNYKGYGNENIITSRGCSHNCSFCASRYLWGDKVRYRSVNNIKFELQDIYDNGNIRQLRICDDNFTMNKKRLLDICKIIKGYDFVWRCSARAEDLQNKKVCDEMYNSGCREVSVGIETGDQRVLNYLNKKTTLEKMKNGCRVAYDSGIAVRVLFMIGTPGEREDTPERNIEYIDKLSYSVITLSTFIPFPGTAIYETPKTYNCEIISRDFAKYNKDYNIKENGRSVKRKYEPLIHNKFLSIEKMIDNVHRMENYVSRLKVNKG